jgi:hypothetical protein
MALRNYPGVVRIADGWEPKLDGSWKRTLLIYVDRELDLIGNDPWLAGLHNEISSVLKQSTYDHATVIGPDGA